MLKSYDASYSNAQGLHLKRMKVGPLSKSPREDGKLKIKFLPLSLQRVSGFYGNSGRYSSWNAIGSFPEEIRDPRSFLPEDLKRKALFDAYVKASEKVANVADLIRTRKETADMVANAVGDLVRAARAIKKGKISRASKILGVPLHQNPKGKEFSERWLEYSYGWSPTLSDIYKICEKGFGDITLSIKTKSKGDYFYSTNDFVGGGFYGYLDSSCVCNVTVQMRLEVPDTAFGAANQWGLDNPAAVMWEAMPFSFAVDWLLPVGDYINASLNVFGNPKIEEMCISTVYTESLSGTIRNYYTPKGKGPANLWQRTISVERTNTIESMPLPSFKNPFTSATRLMNQISLFKLLFVNK